MKEAIYLPQRIILTITINFFSVNYLGGLQAVRGSASLRPRGGAGVRHATITILAASVCLGNEFHSLIKR